MVRNACSEQLGDVYFSMMVTTGTPICNSVGTVVIAVHVADGNNRVFLIAGKMLMFINDTC